MNEAIKKLQRKRWMGAADSCNICDRTLNWAKNKPWFVDGATKMGPWALMCPRCFEQYGIGLGLGRGKKYSTEKPYYKVEG